MSSLGDIPGIAPSTGQYVLHCITLSYVVITCRSEGWEGLLEEIEKDTKRLAQRNLGRDDRLSR